MTNNHYGITALSVVFALVISGIANPSMGQPALVPRTGQTRCYDQNNNNNPVDCPSTPAGQDGEKQAGVAWPDPRFVVNLNSDGTSNGTVTDKLTGLIWLQNAHCFSAQLWQGALDLANKLPSIANQCGLKDGSKQGDWRLPNVRELESLIDYGQNNPPTLPNRGQPFFTDVQSTGYWSSTSNTDTSNTDNPAGAWIVNFGNGSVNITVKTSDFNAVWPVRGGQ